MRILVLVWVLQLLTLSQGFYIYLTNATAQCFYSNLFRDEQLLVEVQTPIVSVVHKIVMTVTANAEKVLEKDIVNQIKLTVPRADVAIHDKSPDSQLEYETCFQIQQWSDSEAAEVPEEAPEEAAVVIPEGYLVSVKLMSNFSHKLESKVESAGQAKVDYRQLEALGERLGTLNAEQVTLHQINEVKEKLTHFYLEQLKVRVIGYSILEILMILLFTVLQVRLLKRYLNDVSII